MLKIADDSPTLPCCHVEHDLREGGGVVGRRLPGRPVLAEAAHEAGVRLQLHLPGKSGNEIFEGWKKKKFKWFI